MTPYKLVEKAINYILEHFKEQPDLETIARVAGLSPDRFQRVFTEWAGVSPKKFIQFLSIEYAKKLLEGQLTLEETSFRTGLSGTSRLHDLFTGIEGMTPGEFKNGGSALTINWSSADSIFGKILVASTQKGICHLEFSDDPEAGASFLQSRFPGAFFKKQVVPVHLQALSIVENKTDLPEIKLHLRGTPFQLKVWQALLRVPYGGLTTYSRIASSIGSPAASRAVGSAVGNNPVAYLIPCHRVIRSSGILGDYHWGKTRKAAMIAREAISI